MSQQYSASSSQTANPSHDSLSQAKAVSMFHYLLKDLLLYHCLEYFPRTGIPMSTFPNENVIS